MERRCRLRGESGQYASLAEAAITVGFCECLCIPPSTGYGSTTPEPVAATTIAATNTITPSQTAGIVGTTTNNNANAGSDGEFISSSVVVGSAVALTTNVTANVTSITLTAGDWDVAGTVSINPAGSTTIAAVIGGISNTTATLPTRGTAAYAAMSGSSVTGYGPDAKMSAYRVSLASSTTFYLVANVNFSVSTCSAYGIISARRVRYSFFLAYRDQAFNQVSAGLLDTNVKPD